MDAVVAKGFQGNLNHGCAMLQAWVMHVTCMGYAYYMHGLCTVLDLAGEVWETFPACYTAQKNEFILPLWRFHQK